MNKITKHCRSRPPTALIRPNQEASRRFSFSKMKIFSFSEFSSAEKFTSLMQSHTLGVMSGEWGRLRGALRTFPPRESYKFQRSLPARVDACAVENVRAKREILLCSSTFHPPNNNIKTHMVAREEAGERARVGACN